VALQQRAPRTLRQHALRAVSRVLGLLVVDLFAFLLFRTLLRVMQDGFSFGYLTELVRRPLGTLGGWQVMVALVVGLLVTGAYHSGDDWRSPRRILGGVLLAVSLVFWRELWWQRLGTAAFHYLVALVALGSFTLCCRLVLDNLAGYLRRRFQAPERVLMVADPEEASSRKVFDRLSRMQGMEMVGWATLQSPAASSEPREGVVGSLDDIWKVMQEHAVDTVVLSGMVKDGQLKQLMEAVVSAGGRLLTVSRYERMGWIRPSHVSYHPISFMELTVPSLRGQQMWVKRGVDLMASFLGLVLVAPLLGLISLAIKLDSRGPVFFSQERVGLGGSTFRMLKFRTMRDGADREKAELAHLNGSGDARLFKIQNDPRITRVGNFLRRWSLDELPQLWNVLRGDMSLVGPRPFFESDLATYREHHFARLGARPGITGLWQVSGRSAITDFEEVVRLDCEYIHRWSLGLDLEILFKTLPAVLKRTGAC